MHTQRRTLIRTLTAGTLSALALMTAPALASAAPATVAGNDPWGQPLAADKIDFVSVESNPLDLHVTYDDNGTIGSKNDDVMTFYDPVRELEVPDVGIAYVGSNKQCSSDDIHTVRCQVDNVDTVRIWG